MSTSAKRVNERARDFGWMAFVFLLAMLSHGPSTVGSEFIGEDELMFTLSSLSWIKLAHGVPDAFREITSFYYPPLQSLLMAPLVWWFGPTEWAVRLPGALCGSASAVLLYAILRSAQAPLLACRLASLLGAVGGIIANSVYAVTVGPFLFGITWSAYGVARFADASTDREADRALWVGATGWVWAAMSLPDAYFYVPVMIAVYLRARGFRFTPSGVLSIMLMAISTIAYAWFWLVAPALRHAGASGGEHKISELMSSFGAFRVHELALTFVSISSWLMALLAPAVLLIAWRVAGKGIRALTWFFAVPLALWTFVFDYPNVRAGHMALAFPAYAILWSLGAARVIALAQARGRAMRWVVHAAVSLTLLSVAWQTYALHMTDRTLRTSIAVLHDFYPSGRRLTTYGQPAAADWLLRNSPPHERVVSNLGGAFGPLYALRVAAHIRDLPSLAADPDAARAAGVRWYVHSLIKGPPPELLSGIPVAVEVRHRGEIILRVYDLWRRHGGVVDIVEAEEGRERLTRARADAWQRMRSNLIGRGV